MQNKKEKSFSINQIIAAFFTILLAILIAVRFDYYYDLNDDLVIKDIIAGIYSGVPEGHCIQMLYPISWLISMCYRICRPVAWYAVFIIGCQFVCLYLVTERAAGYFNRIGSKCAAVIMILVAFSTFFLYELVFTQYTVTASILVATAAFRLYTTEADLSWKQFIKKNIVSILLVVLAYQIRTEMVLLLFPVVCVVGVLKWSDERKIFCRESFQKYLFVIGGILVGMLLSEGINAVAYQNTDWQEFQALFDSRTDLYDFQSIPSFDENQDFYRSIGLSQSEQALFENYNFGIDESIDQNTMQAVADYADEKSVQEQSYANRARSILKTYFGMVFTEKQSLPWKEFVIMMYLLVLILAVVYRFYSFFWKLPLLAGARSIMWLYVIYLNRYPNRITHSLYIVELLVLAAMLLELRNKIPEKIKWSNVPFVLISLFAFGFLYSGVRYVQTEYDRRENVNMEYLALQAYCREHEENVYLLDVYSTVAYSEKMFSKEPNTLANYEYLGGWVSKSPVDRDKLEALGIDTIENAVCGQDNVYVVIHSKREISWLDFYLQEKGYQKEAQKVDEIRSNADSGFDIYQITNK